MNTKLLGSLVELGWAVFLLTFELPWQLWIVEKRHYFSIASHSKSFVDSNRLSNACGDVSLNLYWKLSESSIFEKVFFKAQYKIGIAWIAQKDKEKVRKNERLFRSEKQKMQNMVTENQRVRKFVIWRFEKFSIDFARY